MKLLLALFSLILAASLPKTLVAGRYSLKVSGFFCTACGRAMTEELKALPEIEDAEFNFDAEEVVVRVKLERSLKLSEIRRALRRAAKRVNIGSELDVTAVIYRPT